MKISTESENLFALLLHLDQVNLFTILHSNASKIRHFFFQEKRKLKKTMVICRRAN